MEPYFPLALAVKALALGLTLACHPHPDVTKPVSEIGPLALLHVDQRWVNLITKDPVRADDPHGVDECFALESNAKVEFNGMRLAQFGDMGLTATRADEEYCVFPTFQMPDKLPTSTETSTTDVIRISDSSGEIRMEVADFTATHPITRIKPEGNEVHLGEALEFQYQPEADEAISGSLYFEPKDSMVLADGSAAPVYADTLTPEPPNKLVVGLGPVPLGHGVLHINADLDLPIPRCDGVAKCEVKYYTQPTDFPITVVQ